jgi:hypothetical protein
MPKHGLRPEPRSHGQRGCHVRVEERMFGGFLDLRERSSLSGNAWEPSYPLEVEFFYLLTVLCIDIQLQDKYRQKKHFSKFGIPLPDFMEVMI